MNLLAVHPLQKEWPCCENKEKPSGLDVCLEETWVYNSLDLYVALKSVPPMPPACQGAILTSFKGAILGVPEELSMVRGVPGEDFRWYVGCPEKIFDGTWGARRRFSIVRGVPGKDFRWYVGGHEKIFDGTWGARITFSMVRGVPG